MNSASWRFFACSLGIVVFTLIGCQGRSSSKTKVAQEVDFEPQVELASRLQKPTDLLSASKDVIQAVEASGTKLAHTPLSSTELEELKASLHLSPPELEEVTRVGFTASGLDTAYLAESLLLRDAMTSLGIAKLPPLNQAELALEWVGRQIILQDRLVPISPVWYILQRGAGNHLERAYVFLAALRQLGLDAALIGPRDPGQPHTAVQLGQNRIRLVPFWAVGVRIEEQVYLFNPLTAKPFPASDGKGVATLAQFVAEPKLAENWTAAKSPIAAATANELKEAKVYLVPPLSSLAPRMKSLEERLQSNGVKLYQNYSACLDRFRKALASVKVEISAWNPPDDALTPTRTLAYFLPPDQGGMQKRERGEGSIYDFYLTDTLRLDQLTLNVQDISIARSLLTGEYRKQLSSLFLFGPNLPRERLVRGRLDDAIQLLIVEKDRIDAAKIRVEHDPNVEKDIAAWTRELDRLIAQVRRAQRTNNQEEIERAMREQAEFLRDPKKNRIFETFIVRATSRIQSAESTYLIALAVHEQAERYQIRFETEKLPELASLARETWTNAREWWNRYLQNYPELVEVQKERNQHARNLLRRAESLLQTTPKAKEKK